MHFFLGALRVNSYLYNIFVPKKSATFYVCWKHTLCTLIRLLLIEQSGLGLKCLQYRLTMCEKKTIVMNGRKGYIHLALKLHSL